MRTAIFVHELSTVVISAADPRDEKAELARYRGDTVPAIGSHRLDPGVYVIVSNGPMEVHVRLSYEVATMGTDKDDWPEPKPNVVALEPGATARSISHFLTVAKDLSLDG